jgi:hypothetical protein
MEAFMIQSYVKVDDVTLLKDALVGDSMANDFVDRGAEGFGEMDVVKWRRVRLNVSKPM